MKKLDTCELQILDCTLRKQIHIIKSLIMSISSIE